MITTAPTKGPTMIAHVHPRSKSVYVATRQYSRFVIEVDFISAAGAQQ